MIAGLLRTLVYIVGVWFVWRWLDRAFGGRRDAYSGGSASGNSDSSARRRADDSQEGEYVDFEEVKD